MQNLERPVQKVADKPPLAVPFSIAGHTIKPGERKTIDIPLLVLPDHTPVSFSVHVAHGRKPGPTFFASAAIHGDEIIGVEIVRRLIKSPPIRRVSGTVLLVPIVNTLGFISHSRYLPDRRDLNRSFPGNETGSFASQLAHLMLTEIISRSDFGIDLHSAAIHRSNLPQIRVSDADKVAQEMAQVFGAPVVIKSPLRDGSMRQAALEQGVSTLVYESGEALRFDEFGIRIGVKGVLRVMAKLGMIPKTASMAKGQPSAMASKTKWVRAAQSGILRSVKNTGHQVENDEVLGYVSDPFGETEASVLSPFSGIIIGRTNLPTVNQGDALFHVAHVPRAKSVENAMDIIEEEIEGEPLFDEDEIV